MDPDRGFSERMKSELAKATCEKMGIGKWSGMEKGGRRNWVAVLVCG